MVLRAWAITLVAVLTIGACSLLRDERGAACGFMDEPVAAQFPMAHARDYQRHLPTMGRSPELEHDGRAFVVAFAGPIDLPSYGGPLGIDPNGNPIPRPRQPDLATGVVCVVVNGSPTYYSDVDITGWRS